MTDELSLNERNLYGGRTSEEAHSFLNANRGREAPTLDETKKSLNNAYALADLDNADDHDRAETERLAAQYDPAVDLKHQHEAKAFGDKMPPTMRMTHGHFAPIRAAAEKLGIAVNLDEHAAQGRKDVDAARAHRDTVVGNPKSTSQQRSDAEFALQNALAKLRT